MIKTIFRMKIGQVLMQNLDKFRIGLLPSVIHQSYRKAFYELPE